MKAEQAKNSRSIRAAALMALFRKVKAPDGL